MDDTPKRPNGQNKSNDDQIQKDQEPPKREKSRTAVHNGHCYNNEEIQALLGSDIGKRVLTRIKSHIASKLWDKSRVEDLFQEVCLAIVQNLRKGYVQESWLLPYAMQIANHQLAREYERTTEIRACETSFDVYSDDVDPNAIKNNGSKQQDLSEAEVALNLNKACQSLSEMERKVLGLREIRGYTNEQIATELKITIGNAKLIRHRAGLKIAEYLRGNLYETIFGRRK